MLCFIGGNTQTNQWKTYTEQKMTTSNENAKGKYKTCTFAETRQANMTLWFAQYLQC